MKLPIPTLLVSAVLSLFASLASATPEESKYLLLPPEYDHCSISPDGRFVALHRRILSNPERFSKPRGPSVYSTKIYLLDLATKQIVLAGPPDKKGKNTDPRDWVNQARWGADGTLLILTGREIMSVDPQTGSPIERFNIHATLRKETALPLRDSLDKPLLYYDINWSRGASVALYSLQPKTGKVRRFTEAGLVKDLAVKVDKPRDTQSLSLRSGTKGTEQGYTWELDETGELQVYPLQLDPEWEPVPTGFAVCRDGERLMQRHLEQGDAIAEMRLFNYRSNQFLGASILVQRQDIDLASSLLTPSAIDRARQASGNIPYRQIVQEKVLWLVSQLRSAYPYASVRILNTSDDGNRMVVKVSAQNRPLAFFLFDSSQAKLTKLIEGNSDWAERTLAPGQFISYQSPAEPDGTGVASYIPAISGEPKTDTIINISPEPLYDFDWGFSSTSRFLSAEGFNTLHIIVPWKLQLALARASTPQEAKQALQQCNEFLTTVLQAVQEQTPLHGKAYFQLQGGAAALYPSLPQPTGLEVEKVYLANPRFHMGLPSDSLARLNILNAFPFKRFVDPRTWRTLVAQTPAASKFPVQVIWRENDFWWDQEDGANEQIQSFEQYCKDAAIPYELDRWPQGAWRVFEAWKLNAALTIDLIDDIRGTDSGILEAWR